MQQSMGALPSVTTGPDQFWDELMAKSPHDIAGVRWTTASEAVVARKTPPVSCEKSAPFLVKFASERVNAPTLTLEQRRVHSPMAMHAMDKGPDQFWDEVVANLLHNEVRVAWTAAAKVDVGVRKSPPAPSEESAPLLAAFASKLERASRQFRATSRLLARGQE